MTVKEIVEKYLKDNGYTGLVNSDGECGCEIDDLFPCGELYPECCEPGYKCPAKPDETEAGFDWMITTKKPEGK